MLTDVQTLFLGTPLVPRKGMDLSTRDLLDRAGHSRKQMLRTDELPPQHLAPAKRVLSLKGTSMFLPAGVPRADEPPPKRFGCSGIWCFSMWVSKYYT